jgi:hypothetical protein
VTTVPQNLNRGYVSSTAFLQLDGTDAGPVRSVEGGEPFATVVQSPVGPDGVVGKRVGSVRYAPIVLRASVTGSYRAMFDWIGEVLAGKQTPKSGQVLFADYQARTGSALEWANGLITEVVFPTADASSAEEGVISVTIEPDAARLVSASGPVPSLGIGGKGGLGTARFSAANFAFEISGLEPDCKRVQRVESIVVRQPVVTAPAGVSLVPARTSGLLEVGDVSFVLPEADASAFDDWHKDFVVDGNNAAADERSGSLSFRSSDLRTELLRIDLKQVGITRVSRERADSGAAAFAKVRADLYCEVMALSVFPSMMGAAGAGSGGAGAAAGAGAAGAGAAVGGAAGGPVAVGAAGAGAAVGSATGTGAALGGAAGGAGPVGVAGAAGAGAAAGAAAGGGVAGGADPAVAVQPLAEALAAAIRTVVPGTLPSASPPTLLRGAALAERLRHTEASPSGPEPGGPIGDNRREQGRSLGAEWASHRASLDELSAVAALEEQEWTAIALAEGHSLVVFLVERRELPVGEAGPITLERDAFTEGLADGAADLYREAAPHLETPVGVVRR